MKVYAIYNLEHKFLAAFHTREDAEWYGVQTYGRESGWQYDIIEKYLHEYPTFLSTTPYPLTPYTQPTPYNHNIWRESKGPTATYDGEIK